MSTNKSHIISVVVAIVLIAVIVVVLVLTNKGGSSDATMNTAPLAGEGGDVLPLDQETPQDIGDSATQEAIDPEVADAVRASVEALLVLPTDDNPLVAEITDVRELTRQQAFYQGARNGDYLLIYPSVAKAVIYNVESNMLVNVGPVQFQNDAATLEAPAQ